MKIAINRVKRIRQDVEGYMLKKYPKKISAKVNKKFKELTAIEKKVKKMSFGRVICYVLLYISFVSALLGNLSIIGEILKLFAVISGLLGGAILVAIIALLTKLINIKVADAHTIASYIIAVSVK